MLRILWRIVHEMANDDDVTMSLQNGRRHFFSASSAKTSAFVLLAIDISLLSVVLTGCNSDMVG